MKISKKSLMLMGGGSIILIIFIYIALYKETKEKFQNSTNCDVLKTMLSGNIKTSFNKKNGSMICDIEGDKRRVWQEFHGRFIFLADKVAIFDKKGKTNLPDIPTTIIKIPSKKGIQAFGPALHQYFCSVYGTPLCKSK